MLECVINVSEGRNDATLRALADACQTALLDVHRDVDHNRAVFTLAGGEVFEAAKRLTEAAIRHIDIRHHTGVHPRIGAVDVVPFVPLDHSTWAEATRARDAFARWLADTHAVPSFVYGDERTLPDIRKHAFVDLQPNFGPVAPHPSAGSCAVGARPVLVAYNLWLKDADFATARHIAREIRRPGLRTLGLQVGKHTQVSCNLVDTHAVGPSVAYDLVAQYTEVSRAELVGLLPTYLLESEPRDRWQQLDISPAVTIEARLTHR